MKDGLTFTERFVRDGKRWRYIWMLERELKALAWWRPFIIVSALINVVLLAIIAWLVLA